MQVFNLFATLSNFGKSDHSISQITPNTGGSIITSRITRVSSLLLDCLQSHRHQDPESHLAPDQGYQIVLNQF